MSLRKYQCCSCVLISVVGLVVLCSNMIVPRNFTKIFKVPSLQPPRPQPELEQSSSRETDTRHTDKFCHTSLLIYDLRRVKNPGQNKNDEDGSIMGERNSEVNEKNNSDRDNRTGSLSGKTSNSFKGEIRHIIFPKVHKAASSTTQGILLRFAVARNLSAMLPKTKILIRRNDDKFNMRDIVPPYKHSHGLYDILANHLVFNANKLAPHFPNDTVRFAFVREPIKYGLSALAYYTTIGYPILKKKFAQYPLDPNTAFINNPAEFYDTKDHASNSFINNRISIDLGIDTTNFEATKRNMSKICEFVRKMDRELDFVLIVEFFDESMVLLKRLLNWQLRDILYIKMNTLDSHHKNDSVWRKKPVLTPENQKTFHQWAVIDYALYEHFSARFNKTIEKQPFFSEEVQVFKELLNEVQELCLKKDISFPLTIKQTRFSAAFDYTARDCMLLQMKEAQIVEYARQLQKA